MTDAANPYATAEPWEVSTGSMLTVGNHRIRISDLEDGTNSKGNPKLTLRVTNAAGQSLGDFLHYHEGFLDKVVALFDACQIERPQAGEFDPNDHCRLTAACIKRLDGKEAGVVVRLEDDYKNEIDPNTGQVKQWPTVMGYVTVDKIGDAPIVTAGLPGTDRAQAQAAQTTQAPGAPSRPGEPDIPF